MNKFFAVLVAGAVAVGSVAMATTTSVERADEARVNAQIDARLHQLLLAARLNPHR